ncbi:MAG TPA: hypothetical protein VMQ61_12435 [Thermoanaerobaculia bacterium]|nr:hypothetical protein [Thermoanaerobaculia bacterium]
MKLGDADLNVSDRAPPLPDFADIGLGLRGAVFFARAVFADFFVAMI